MRHADCPAPAISGAPAGRRQLYPDIVPYRTGWLKVPGGHEIYFEECGSPAGKPALMVHGGPGGGCNPIRAHRRGRYAADDGRPAGHP